MLDTSSGNYDVFTVNDSTEKKTTVSVVEGRVSDAQRTSEQNLLQTMKKLVNFKVEEERETPVSRRQRESALQLQSGLFAWFVLVAPAHRAVRLHDPCICCGGLFRLVVDYGPSRFSFARL